MVCRFGFVVGVVAEEADGGGVVEGEDGCDVRSCGDEELSAVGEMVVGAEEEGGGLTRSDHDCFCVNRFGVNRVDFDYG